MKFEKIINFVSLFSIFVIVLQPLFGMTIYYISIFLTLGLACLNIIKRNKIKINYYEVLMIMFIILCFISKIYAISQEAANYGIKELALNFLLVFSILDYTQRGNESTEKKYKKILDIFSIATTILSIYLLIFELPQVLTARDRLGRELFAEYGTYMTISYDLIISNCYLLWKIIYKKNTKFTYIELIILIITSVFSGTRKTLICPIIFVLIVLAYKSRRNIIKILKYLIISVFLLFISYQVIMTNQTLYKIIGQRIERSFSNFFEAENGISEEDASIDERNLLKKLAIAAFDEKPLLGWGINNFANYSQLNNGPFLYAHCNYLELLSSVGIIGTGIYYGGYCYIMYLALKRLKKNDIFSIFIIGFMLMNLISDYETVSYIKIQYMLLFMLCAKYLNEKKEKEEDKNEIIK